MESKNPKDQETEVLGEVMDSTHTFPFLERRARVGAYDNRQFIVGKYVQPLYN